MSYTNYIYKIKIKKKKIKSEYWILNEYINIIKCRLYIK